MRRLKLSHNLAILCIMSLSLGSCFSKNATNENNDDDSDETEILVDNSGLIILQAYGVGNPLDGGNTPALSHSFIELYNPTEISVSLQGYSLQYSTGGTTWSKLDLSGNIDARCSYLIVANGYGSFTKQEIDTTGADILWSDQIINNKGGKICLLKNSNVLNVVNPFNSDDQGNKVSGYTDLIGMSSSDITIDGYETTAMYGPSKQKSLRRTSLVDTNDNSLDFEIIDYSDLSTIELQKYTPKSSSFGAWDPYYIIQAAENNLHLMILQAYGNGNKSTPALSNSFVELYNPTADDILLNGYSLQYASSGNSWNRLDLEGTIPAQSSFFILAGTSVKTDAKYLLDADDADMIWTIDFSNDSYKLCLMNSLETLNVNNPFNMDDNGTIIEGYIDMVGAINSVTLDGFESEAIGKMSKQKSVRRNSITDTNNNKIDFEIIDYSSIEESDFAFYCPKGTYYGSWNPFIS